jgi:hypothetical protein
MSLKQFRLLAINIFLFTALAFVWGTTSGTYPPVEDMITAKVKIISINPKIGRNGSGSIEFSYNNKTMELSTHLRESSFSRAGYIIGREAIIMVKPGKYGISHLEIVDGEVILDYRKEYNEHIYLMNYYPYILHVIQFLSLFFSFGLRFPFVKKLSEW